jgi:ATP-dependent exoDNAse (exonuclease V) beta subunit
VRCADPNDHLALLAWLRSPSVGVPDAALVPLWTRSFPTLVASLPGQDAATLAAPLRVIDEAVAALPRDVPGLERIAGWERNLRLAVAGLAAARESFALDAADVFVEKLRALSLLELTEAARHPGAFRLANLERFFRELREELEAEDADLQALLRRLRSDVASERQAEDARPLHAVGDAVRVMTIHQAKGLEFEHCYVVQLHKQAAGDARDRGRFKAVEGPGGWEYRVFDAQTPGFAQRRADPDEVAAAERVRSLYVAMTRARSRLVLLGSWSADAAAKPPSRIETYAQLLAARSGAAALARAMDRAERAAPTEQGRRRPLELSRAARRSRVGPRGGGRALVT